MFCGVGPFALPAARKGCLVWANDLNPESIRWLRHNIALNRIGSSIHVHNMDASEFLRKALEELRAVTSIQSFDHFIMNLPASAYQFLDAFAKLCREGIIKEDCTSWIHCYTFCKADTDPISVNKIYESLIL